MRNGERAFYDLVFGVAVFEVPNPTRRIAGLGCILLDDTYPVCDFGRERAHGVDRQRVQVQFIVGEVDEDVDEGVAAEIEEKERIIHTHQLTHEVVLAFA
jgi:hypothetical protein